MVDNPALWWGLFFYLITADEGLGVRLPELAVVGFIFLFKH
ncbi:hypothetical protein [Anabaena sphaerica]|nr:hypothetical protein [Anabaena sphaerica]